MFVFGCARNSRGIHELGAATVTVAHPSVQERLLAIPVFKNSNPHFALNLQAGDLVLDDRTLSIMLVQANIYDFPGMNTLRKAWQITIFSTAYPLSHLSSKHRGKLYRWSGACFTQHLRTQAR